MPQSQVMASINSGLAHMLGPDDLPMCPKHGVRLATDYFESKDGVPEYELGYCPMCKRHYRFEFEQD
jgi:hypothetical protein